jgi:hypothetical protein
MIRRCLAAVVLLACSASALAANAIDLNVNNSALRLKVDFELSNNILVDGSWFYDNDRGNVFGAGFHLTGAATGGANPVYAGLGGQLLWIDSKTRGRDDGQALPIGGFVRYTIPEYDRFSVGGSLYFAPSVLSFGDVDQYYEYTAWAGYHVLRDGVIYLGVRRIRAEFDKSPSVSFDTGIHVGVRLRF